VFLVGGGEVVTEPLYTAMDMLGLLRVPRTETGIAPGEGAAYLVVEREEHARARGATPIGYLLGYGTSYEAPPREALLHHVSRRAVARAMETALADASISKDDVDLVLSAEDGIVAHDEEERAGIASVLGDVRVVSPKRWFGETFGAAGALGMTAALACFDGARLGGVEQPDFVVVTTVGFYGNVSAVVLGRPRFDRGDTR
jgi:3-oxoacyl-(acyl-carrier-protein) synthase